MLTDTYKNVYELGQQIGQRGGEGAVFEVIGHPSLVAKEYTEAQPNVRWRKIAAQIAASHADILPTAAWPQAILYRNAAPVGFLMQRALGKPIHLLYRPIDRREHFPKVSWQDLVRVSQNVAVAFYKLHQRDILMADVNETNLLITPSGEVKLIDCDSYQLVGPTSERFLCPVGTAFWTPPELQGVDFSKVPRTVHHDLFGLAALIFHILFMGRHPFAGVPRAESLIKEPPTLEDCIRGQHFAYARNANRHQIHFDPPPHSLPLSALPSSLADLFEQAFLTQVRPTADVWHRTLGATEFQKCIWGHHYYRRSQECPWCAIWNSGGTNFFVGSITFDASGTSIQEIESLIGEIGRFHTPALGDVGAIILKASEPNLAIPSVAQFAVAQVEGKAFPRTLVPYRFGYFAGWLLALAALVGLMIAPAVLVVWIAVGLAGLGLIAGGINNPEYAAEIRRRHSNLETVRMALENAHNGGRARLNGLVGDFKAERQRVAEALGKEQSEAMRNLALSRRNIANSLGVLAKEYRDLPNRRLNLMNEKTESAKKEDFLRRHRIASHKISQIGPARSNVLDKYGIVTAWDVKQMRYVPRLGQGECELRAWAAKLETRFRYDPSVALSSSAAQDVARDMQKLEQVMLQRYQSFRREWLSLVREYDEGRLRALQKTRCEHEMAKLAQRRASAENDARLLKSEIEAKVREYAQAEADVRCCPALVS